jgi:hypothetical protein
MVGYFTGSAVCVRGASSIAALHDWRSGAFGELVDDLEAHSCEEVPQHDRCLMLSTLEAYFLTFEQRRMSIYEAASGSEGAGVCAIASPPTTTADRSGAGSSSTSGDTVKQAPRLMARRLLESDCWRSFCVASGNFPHRYAVYRSLRREGWVIRTGMKYGADFACYAPGEGACGHAMLSALVVSSSEPAEYSCAWLQQHVRLCHGVAKGANHLDAATLLLRPAAQTGALCCPSHARSSWRKGQRRVRHMAVHVAHGRLTRSLDGCAQDCYCASSSRLPANRILASGILASGILAGQSVSGIQRLIKGRGSRGPTAQGQSPRDWGASSQRVARWSAMGPDGSNASE